jgi:hypothetical protein
MTLIELIEEAFAAKDKGIPVDFEKMVLNIYQSMKQAQQQAEEQSAVEED